MRERPTLASHRLDLPSICDICGRARSTGKHAKCSRTRPIRLEYSSVLVGWQTSPAGLLMTSRSSSSETMLNSTAVSVLRREPFVKQGRHRGCNRKWWLGGRRMASAVFWSRRPSSMQSRSDLRS